MFKVKVSDRLDYAGIAITILRKRADEFQQVVPFDLTFTPLQSRVRAVPCLIINEDDRDFLYALAQGLVDAGYLPDIVKDKEKELEATKYHLSDMRKLVFKIKEV